MVYPRPAALKVARIVLDMRPLGGVANHIGQE